MVDELANRVLQFCLAYLTIYCLAMAVLGRWIKRLAGWLAMLGEPKRDDCRRPSKYVEGGWR